MRKSLDLFKIFGVVGILVWGCAACSASVASSADKARETSTKSAQAAAERSLKRLRETLLVPQPAADLVEKTLAEIKSNEIAETTLIGSRTDPNGDFSAELSFVAITAAGGGGDYVKIPVRLCARYSGTVGPTGQVSIADLVCPPGLPSSVEHLTVDSTAKLGS
jgi:hypothetical protein